MKITIITPVYNNENNVIEALESVVAQDLEGLELIVINDGSTDNSDRVIRDYIQQHPEIIYLSQENKGVSAARNAGLDIATGEYIGFLDSDDVYTPDALKNMLFVAEKHNADLVVGEQRLEKAFRTTKQNNSARLSKKVCIKKDDPELVYNFSCCNKLFKQELIEKHGIRFQPIKHAEDGLFLFTYLQYCEGITGCPKYVYKYRRKLPIEEKSTLSNINKDMLDNVLESAEQIGEIIKSFSIPMWEELLFRILRVTLINEYYRKLWNLDDEAQNKLLTELSKYKQLVNEEYWNEFVSISTDIELEDHFRTTDEIAEAPLISVIIPDGLNNGDYSNLLETLYYQRCPNFEVVADEHYREFTEENFYRKKNFRFADSTKGGTNTLIKEAKGRFVHYVDAPCIYSDNSLDYSYRKLIKSDCSIVAIHPFGYQDGNTYFIGDTEEIYKDGQVFDIGDPNGNYIDSLFVNKLLSRELFLKLSENSSENTNCLCERLPRTYIGIARPFLEQRGIVAHKNVQTEITAEKKKPGNRKKTSFTRFLKRNVRRFCRRLLPLK